MLLFVLHPSGWITGVHPVTLGTLPMRSRYEIPHDQIKYYPDYLKDAGTTVPMSARRIITLVAGMMMNAGIRPSWTGKAQAISALHAGDQCGTLSRKSGIWRGG